MNEDLDPTQPDLTKEVLAGMQLKDQGSIMGQDRPQRPFQGTPNLDPLLQTIGELLGIANPINWMGGAGGATSAAGLAGRTGKTFTEAAPATIEGLIQSLGKGASSMPGRASLRPALRHTGTGEIASGGIGAGHGSIYDVIPPTWQKNVQHGFLHPEGQFLTQSLIDALVQPKILKQLSGGLTKGKSLDELLQSMMLPKYTVGSAQKLPPSLP